MRYARLLAGACLLCAVLAARAADDTPPQVAGFDSTFVQTRTLPGFSAPLISHGIMRFDPAHGFHWEITSPYHYVFEMNGKQAHEQLPDGTRRDLDPEQTPWLAAVEHIFVSALGGDRADLESYFAIAVTPLSAGQRVSLTPKPGPMANAIVSIEVTESAPGHPQRLEIRETSGGRMDIVFSPATRPVSAP
jgi:hypothetical protein